MCQCMVHVCMCAHVACVVCVRGLLVGFSSNVWVGHITRPALVVERDMVVDSRFGQ